MYRSPPRLRKKRQKDRPPPKSSWRGDFPSPIQVQALTFLTYFLAVLATHKGIDSKEKEEVYKRTKIKTNQPRRPATTPATARTPTRSLSSGLQPKTTRPFCTKMNKYWGRGGQGSVKGYIQSRYRCSRLVERCRSCPRLRRG